MRVRGVLLVVKRMGEVDGLLSTSWLFGDGGVSEGLP